MPMSQGGNNLCGCQGGFCELILPPTSSSLSPEDNIAISTNRCSNLSKREKRLQKSRERDCALRLLKWILTEEEYSALEESGNLVRLKVGDDWEKKETRQNSAGGGSLCLCVNRDDVDFAKREHRPELARLAFAEFMSGEEGYVHAVENVKSDFANDLFEPHPSEGRCDDLFVCRVCHNAYCLLEQARALLDSYKAGDDQVEAPLVSSPGGNNQSEKIEENVTNTPQNVDIFPSNHLKKVSSEGANSLDWRASQKPLFASASFHTQISPQTERNGSCKCGEDLRSSGKGSRKSSFVNVGKKRNRKQAEENSKNHVLIADSDEATTKLAKRLLEKQGFKVDTVSNGSDCIKSIESKTYSVLLLNEMLSGKDAHSIGKWIRNKEKSETCHVKTRILVLVQRVLSINYHEYAECDIDGFLPKPLEGSKLIPSVEKATSQYRDCMDHTGSIKASGESSVETMEKVVAKKIASEKVLTKQSTTSENIPAKPHLKNGEVQATTGSIKKTKPAIKSPNHSYMTQKADKLKKEDRIAFESVFHYDENTSFPYAILHNGPEESMPESPQNQQSPWCNLIVCQDVFDTFERFKIFFLPMVARYTGIKILLWNYPGQAFTSFKDESNLNNKYHSDCLSKLLDHVNGTGRGKFSVDQPHFILSHGSGAAIATYFAAAHRRTSLKGIILVNGLSHVDSHYASVFHDCRNVFSCSPESRPDLPVYFYARFLFSPSYLSKTSSSLALNVYTAIHNPITLHGRKRLCQGVLNHVDTRPLLKDIGYPIISIHGENAALVRAIHASEFVRGRRSCPTITQALRGGNRTTVVMMKGGHELFQEKKEQITQLIEQILTGYHDKIRLPPQNPVEDGGSSQEIDTKIAKADHEEDHFRQKTKTFEDKFIDNVLREGRKDHSSWDTYQEEIMMHEPASQSKSHPKNCAIKKEQSAKLAEEKKDFDPNEYPEVKEYMAWRIRRHKKRLAALERSAQVIQCTLRVFMAKTMIGRLRKQVAATLIQSYFRGIFGRIVYIAKKKELWAAMLVQRAIRGHNGRCDSFNKRMERKAQISLARVIRGIVSRRRFRAVLEKRELAATDIQSAWRMHAAVKLLWFHRSRQAGSIVVQRILRGHFGRRKAMLERDKYIFSRSQNSGIELGRQMLTEHKLHATKIQSEIFLLNQEKSKTEKQIEFALSEISNFERIVSELEKKMHQLSKLEREKFGSISSSEQNEFREEKRRMDEDFSETLVKISDRKLKLENLEKTFEHLSKIRLEKFGQLKKLEGKLAVLLEAQDSALESIRMKQERRIESVMPTGSCSLPPTSDGIVIPFKTNILPPRSEAATNHFFTGPSEKDKMQAAQLIDSTETMMKFGFMSMSLTYFSSLNMMRAMQRVAANDTLSSPQAATDDNKPYQNVANSTILPSQQYGSNSDVRVEGWSVNDVSKWLTSISLSQYQASFKEGAVDGTFLCELTDDDLRNTLGVEHRLHRKKILFSIRCLQNLAEVQASHSTPSIHPRHQMYSGSGSKSVASASPNSTIYDDSMVDLVQDEGFSKGSRSIGATRNGSHGEPSPKSNSILDIMTPTKPEKKPFVPLCDFDQLRSWVRHQKHENIREALDHMTDAPFHSKNIRIQFVEEVGTAYTHTYDQEPFNLNRVDEHGNTLMHTAAQTGNIRIAKLLLRKGGNPNHQNKQGQTPGHFAVAYHFFDFASWLFDEKGGGANDLLTNMYDLGPYDGLDE